MSYVHVFPEKDRLSLSAQGKNIMFSGKKIPSFQIIQEGSCAGTALFGKTIFLESSKKISYFHVFFWERSSFIFRLRYKIIFSGKRNIIFPDNRRKIIFQGNFFWKDHLFRTSGKRKCDFPCSENLWNISWDCTDIKPFFIYINPVDTGLKLTLRKMFRRRHGHPKKMSVLSIYRVIFSCSYPTACIFLVRFCKIFCSFGFSCHYFLS